MAFSFSTYFLCFFSMLIFFISHMNPTRAIRATSSLTSTEFIKTSCKVATFPDLCYRSLSSYASDIQTSPKILASSALSVTIATGHTTLDTVSTLSKSSGILPREVDAVRDCLEVLGDAVEELQNSVDEMSRIKDDKKLEVMVNDVQTWVSAALTNEDTCMEGFDEKGMFGKIKVIVRGKIVNLCHLTSNALALINSYASLQG